MRDKANDELWSRYRRSRNNLVTAIRRAKRASWKQFTEDTDSPEKMNKLTKAIFKSEGKIGRTSGETGRILHPEQGGDPGRAPGCLFPGVNRDHGTDFPGQNLHL